MLWISVLDCVSLESNHRDRLFARRRVRGRATGELRESADEDDINADLDGCGREGGYGDEDNGEHAMPVRDFVWMTRLSAAFADVTKDGPAALLTAAPAPSGDKDDVTVWPLKRMSPGALVVAKIDGREKTCRVLKYHPEGVATGGGKFDLRDIGSNSVYVGAAAILACDVSIYCVREATTDQSERLEFREIDATRALGLILDEVGNSKLRGT